MTSGPSVNDGPTWSEERHCNKALTFDLGLDGNVRPDEGICGRVMGVEDEFEDIETAPASVRARLLGTRNSSMGTGGDKNELRVRVAKPVVEPTTEERRIHRMTHCQWRCESGSTQSAKRDSERYPRVAC